MAVSSKAYIPLDEALQMLEASVEVVDVRQEFFTRCQKLYQADPVGFSREILGVIPWDKQVEILESVRDNERTTVKSCNSAGKTAIAAVTCLWFNNSFVPSTVVTTAPTARQVRDLLWREINTRHVEATEPLPGRCLQTQLIQDEKRKWFATGFSTDKADVNKFSGYHNEWILVIVDEAAGVSRSIYEAIDTLLASGNARLLLIGNPTDETGEFGRAFRSQFYNKITISAFDTPNFTNGEVTHPYLIKPAWEAMIREKYGVENPYYQVHVLAEFPVDTGDNLIPYRRIEAAKERGLEGLDVEFVSLGVDVAREGSDESVIAVVKGDVQVDQAIFRKLDTMALANWVTEYIQQYRPQQINVDVIGVGGGVVDRLRQLGYQVNDVNVERKAKDRERFINQRAEMFFELRGRFMTGQIKILDDPDLIAQLAAFKIKYQQGKFRLPPKDETKKELGASPDRADALALAFYRPSFSQLLGDVNAIAETMMGATQVSETRQWLAQAFKMEALADACPSCTNKMGMSYSNESGNCSREEATRAKCLICGHVQEAVNVG